MLQPRCVELLSLEERARLAAFRTEEDRARRCIGWGMRRDLLSRYLGVESKSLVFEQNAHGKPLLAPELAHGLEFSSSYSGDWVVFAVARRRRVGVDIEMHVEEPVEDTVETHFTREEREYWRTLPREQRLQNFFRMWACKEAYLKAVGVGLTRPLNSFHVSLAETTPAVARCNFDPDAAKRWRIYSFSPTEAYSVVVVAEAPSCHLSFGRYK